MVPVPPVGRVRLLMSAGLNGEQPAPLEPIVPAAVTLLQVAQPPKLKYKSVPPPPFDSEQPEGCVIEDTPSHTANCVTVVL